MATLISLLLSLKLCKYVAATIVAGVNQSFLVVFSLRLMQLANSTLAQITLKKRILSKGIGLLQFMTIFSPFQPLVFVVRNFGPDCKKNYEERKRSIKIINSVISKNKSTRYGYM